VFSLSWLVLEQLDVEAGQPQLELVDVNRPAAIHVHLCEDLLSQRFLSVGTHSILALVLAELVILVNKEAHKRTQVLHVKPIECVNSNVLVEGLHALLEILQALIESRFLARDSLVREVERAQRSQVVDADELIVAGLQHHADAVERRGDLGVKDELGSVVELVVEEQGPNLEFVLVVGRGHDVTDVFVGFGFTFHPHSVGGVFDFDDLRDALLGVIVKILHLGDLLVVNRPDFSVTVGRTHTDVVLVDLKKRSGVSVSLLGPEQNASASFQIDVTDQQQPLGVVGDAEDSAG
jgi:hypothetical protein